MEVDDDTTPTHRDRRRAGGAAVFLGGYDPPDPAVSCWNVARSGTHLFIANGCFGMTVVELSPRSAEVASLGLPALAGDIAEETKPPRWP